MANKAIRLSKVPSAGALQKAMVGMVDARMESAIRDLKLKGPKQLREMAEMGLELCSKACHFCGKPFPKQKKVPRGKSRVWGDVTLCDCFARLRTAYREYLPWKAPEGVEPAILAMIGKPHPLVKGENVTVATVVYTDGCSHCGQTFAITAGTILKAWQKYHAYKQQKCCRSCRKILQERQQGEQATPEKKPAKRPSRGARPTELKATLGQQLAAKAAAREVTA